MMRSDGLMFSKRLRPATGVPPPLNTITCQWPLRISTW
jgi:hypothetical protein